jgi:hypothetical protein
MLFRNLKVSIGRAGIAKIRYRATLLHVRAGLPLRPSDDEQCIPIAASAHTVNSLEVNRESESIQSWIGRGLLLLWTGLCDERVMVGISTIATPQLRLIHAAWRRPIDGRCYESIGRLWELPGGIPVELRRVIVVACPV